MHITSYCLYICRESLLNHDLLFDESREMLELVVAPIDSWHADTALPNRDTGPFWISSLGVLHFASLQLSYSRTKPRFCPLSDSWLDTSIVTFFWWLCRFLFWREWVGFFRTATLRGWTRWEKRESLFRVGLAFVHGRFLRLVSCLDLVSLCRCGDVRSMSRWLLLNDSDVRGCFTFRMNKEPFLERRRQQVMEDVESTIRRRRQRLCLPRSAVLRGILAEIEILRAACGLEGSGLIILFPVRVMGKPCSLVWLYHESVQYAILSIPLSGWLERLWRGLLLLPVIWPLAGIKLPHFLSLLDMPRRWWV